MLKPCRESKIEVSGILVLISFKNIKNLHLSVSPPEGLVRIAAPANYDTDHIRLKVISKIDWIKRNLSLIDEQCYVKPPQYLQGESLYIFGVRHLLKLEMDKSKPVGVVCSNAKYIVCNTHRRLSNSGISSMYEEWERALLLQKIKEFLMQQKLDQHITNVFIRNMKQKWFSRANKKLNFNPFLVSLPLFCLDYVLSIAIPEYSRCYFSVSEESIKKELNRLTPL